MGVPVDTMVRAGVNANARRCKSTGICPRFQAPCWTESTFILKCRRSALLNCVQGAAAQHRQPSNNKLFVRDIHRHSGLAMESWQPIR